MSQKKEQRTEVETTGHSWDGIEELNNPLPKWWLWVFYATIIWGVLYTIAYPAWPGINSATAGVLGYSTRAEVAEEIASVESSNAEINARLAGSDLTQIAADPELQSFAVNAGGAVFRTWCAQCHGSGAAGAVGYPNLLDDDWLWGGDIESIHATIAHGVRNEVFDDARWSEMPAFGEILEDDEIDAVVAYVQSLSGVADNPNLEARGQAIYEEQCSGCHGDDGRGDRAVGAPNLADAIWLWGGDAVNLEASIRNARFGVMPGWSDRLSEAQIAAVAAYVHGLGGGEASPD